MRKIIGQVRTPWIWMVAALLASPASSAQAQVPSGPLPWSSVPAARMSAVQAAVAGPTCPLTFLHYSRCGASEVCQLSCGDKTMWDLVNGKPRTLTPTTGGCADRACPDGVCDTLHLYTYYAEELAQCDSSTKTNPDDPYGGVCVCYDMAGSGTTDFPAYETDIATGCSAATPREVCSNGQDDNCNGLVDCADALDCPGGTSCGAYGKICGSGASAGTCICPSGTKETCDDGLDNNCNGLVDDDCPETCGDGIDNNANGAIDDTCTVLRATS